MTDGLIAALARAQAAMSHPKKTKTNPHFKSDYADLADVLNAVRPALNAEGIAVVQTIDNGDLVTELRWNDEAITSRLPLNLDVKPQELGSQLSYLRRYALSAIAGVASENDDDGNAAQTAPRPQARPRVSSGPELLPLARDLSPDSTPIPVQLDPYALAAANPPEKPIAAMTMAELIAYGRQIGVVMSGSKSDFVRTLEPYVLAATGAEPWDTAPVEGEGDSVGRSFAQGVTPSPPRPEPDAIPFEPVVAKPTAERKSVRSFGINERSQ